MLWYAGAMICYAGGLQYFFLPPGYLGDSRREVVSKEIVGGYHERSETQNSQLEWNDNGTV